MKNGITKTTSHDFLEIVRDSLCESSEINALKVLKNKKLFKKFLDGILSGEIELNQQLMTIYHPSGRLDLSPEIQIP